MVGCTRETINDISNIIASKSSISYLCKCIITGSIHTGKGFIPSIDSSNGIDSCTSSSWIRLVRLNKVFLKRYVQWKQSARDIGDQNNNNMYLNFFNTKANRDYVYIGSNVDRDVNLAGYHYNACDIYNSYMMEGCRARYEKCDYFSKSISFFIYKLLFIGKRNFLIGFIDKGGILYLDYVILNKLKETNQEKFKEVIINILSIYANFNSIFFELNINGITGEITERVKRTLFTGINETSQDCSIIKPEHIDIFNNSSQVDNLLSKMQDIIKNEIENYLNGTNWGIKNQYSFKDIIDEIKNKKYYSTRYDVEKAFANGLLYGNKFELSGWSVSDRQFDNSVTWEKDVHIIPSRAVHNRKLYIIDNNDPTWTNPFHIDKLYVTASGKMYCEGNHPNVSSQNVCMGDIAGKIVLSDVKKLGENLNRCEALLTLINYDSAYSNIDREFILEHSTLDPTCQFDIDHEYVGDNEALTDVSFEDDEEVKDESDVDNDTNIEIINEEEA